MRKLLLTFTLVSMASLTFAQVVFKGISPAAVQGTYDYGVQANCGSWPGETDDGTWPVSIDFNVPGSYIQGELMLVEDGTLGTNPQGNPISQEGCNPLTNDLTGKIAVVYRNTCSFGSKVAYAQDAGAIGVIVVNREDAAIAMLADANFPNDTIPAIIIDYTIGSMLIDEMQNGPVVMFIGNKVGVFANDMASDPAQVGMTESTAIPSTTAQNGTEFSVETGMWLYNIGSTAQSGVTVDVDIVYNGGASVYSNTSASLNFAAPAGLVLDTQYVDLGTFAPASWPVGSYTMTYTINTPGGDDDASDNVFSYEFKITADNKYAKSRTDANTDPIKSTAYSLNETTTLYDNWEACVMYTNANASRTQAMGMTLSCQPVGTSMAGTLIYTRVYEWNDSFTDLNDPNYTPLDGGVWTLNQVGGGYYYYLDDSESEVNIYIPFLDVNDNPTSVPMTDSQRYLFCAYNDEDSLRIGFDTKLNYYSTVVDHLLQWTDGIKVAPNGAAEEWYGNNGFGYDAVPAFTVDFDVQPTAVEEMENNTEYTPYPNPASNLLYVPVRKNVAGNIRIEAFDLSGKLVLSETQTIGQQRLRLNVASMANGSYIFKMTFADGSQDSYKISINR